MTVSENKRPFTLLIATVMAGVVLVAASAKAQDVGPPVELPRKPLEAAKPQAAPSTMASSVSPAKVIVPTTNPPVQPSVSPAAAPTRTLTTPLAPPASLAPPAQLSPPTTLRPAAIQPSQNNVPGQPASLTPVILRPLPTSNSLTPIDINVEELKTLDPDSLGTLTTEQGGFGVNMWDGSSRRKIERLLPKLPTSSISRGMRDLMRRLLLSAAKAPAGEPLVPGEKDLIGTRLELLSTMGDLPGVSSLIKEVPTTAHSERLLRSEVDALFMKNDNARVCSLVSSQISEVETPYWQKAFVFCQSLAGEHEKAALGASLLRETGDNDQIFNGLLEHLSGLDEYKVASLANPEPLHFAMVRAAKADLPADVTSSDNPAILRTIATSPNARPELRLDAAERAEAMGALNTEILRQLYAGVTFTEDALENPLTTADSERSPLSRALLYRKALVESVPAATAEVLSKALKLGREGGRLPSLARVYLPILRGINPTQDFIWFSPEAIRAFLAAGDLKSAGQWFAMLKTASLLDESAAKILNEIQPLARLAGAIEDTEWEPSLLANWWQAANTHDEENPVSPDIIRSRAALLYNLIDSLGDKVGDEEWGVLLQGPPQGTAVMPQPALWRSLEIAAANLNIGETVLLSLLALGESGPTQANPTVLHKVITSLRQIGLEQEARAIALEAAVASGL